MQFTFFANNRNNTDNNNNYDNDNSTSLWNLCLLRNQCWHSTSLHTCLHIVLFKVGCSFSMNTHQQCIPLFGSDGCHCQLPRAALTAPNHTPLCAGDSPFSTATSLLLLSVNHCQWVILYLWCGCPSGQRRSLISHVHLLLDWYRTDLTGLSVSILFYFAWVQLCQAVQEKATSLVLTM